MLKKKIVFVFLTKVIFVTLDSFLAAKDTQKKERGEGVLLKHTLLISD